MVDISMRSVFHCFLLWVKDLVIFELRFGFLVKNCIYGRLDMSRILKVDQKMTPRKKGTKTVKFSIFLQKIIKLFTSSYIPTLKDKDMHI